MSKDTSVDGVVWCGWGGMQDFTKSMRASLAAFMQGSDAASIQGQVVWNSGTWRRLVRACNVIAQDVREAVVFGSNDDAAQGLQELQLDARAKSGVQRVFVHTAADAPGQVALHINGKVWTAGWTRVEDGLIPRAPPGPRQDAVAATMTAMWCIARAYGRMADVSELDTARCNAYIAHVLATYS